MSETDLRELSVSKRRPLLLAIAVEEEEEREEGFDSRSDSLDRVLFLGSGLDEIVVDEKLYFVKNIFNYLFFVLDQLLWHADFSKRWHLCQLEVLDCKKVAWPNSVTEEKYCVEDCGWPLKEFAYECKINLLTGRTRQIRAQLAACGAPIVGDSMYMPPAIAEMISPGLNLFGKYKKQCTSEYDKVMAMQEWISYGSGEQTWAFSLVFIFLSLGNLWIIFTLIFSLY
ncbi:RNA pseudouridine synthase 6, chloroplastic-like [Camellia sinensis]|uniref:RNA pseudouridine synthase 6, chloroplastic-like n=1 Tax=Camellia sinensis TaxID=4442 RepID=UPI001036C57E|nr:RNA pseudouridine synthase 6, chloroplastic-like [Camellia sinensis]